MSKRTTKSADQKANENVIVLWCAVVFFSIAITAGLAHHVPNVNHDASRQAVDQVNGAR